MLSLPIKDSFQRSLLTLKPGPYGIVVNDVSPPDGSDANLPPCPFLQHAK